MNLGLIEAIAADVQGRMDAEEAKALKEKRQKRLAERIEKMSALRAAVRAVGITRELWDALGMRYDLNPDVFCGSVVFTLPDERGVADTFELKMRLDAHNDQSLEIPRIGKNAVWEVSGVGRQGYRSTIHSPLPPSSSWGETIAYLAAKWVREMEQNRQTLSERAAKEFEARARVDAERAERRARAEAVEAEVAALEAEQEQVAVAMGEAIADLEVWPEGKVLTLYRWQWCKGSYYDDDSEEHTCEYDGGLSMSDRLDDSGYVDILTRGRVRLMVDVHKPVVDEITLASLQDLQNAKIYMSITTVPVHVIGASDCEWGDGEASFWRWGSEGKAIEKPIKAPVSWLRSLLGTPDSYTITVQPPTAE